MEKELRYELQNRISELTIYPTNAPENAARPYLVYTRINTRNIKTLNGFINKQELSFMFSIMAKRYEDMSSYSKQVEEMLKSFPLTRIGKNASIYVEDLNINNITETYEKELELNREIIDFTIYV
jgi:hypothetical protein